MNLTKNQYWVVIFLILIFVIVNGYLVLKIFKDELPKQCPVPVEEINTCSCVYNALGDQSLRYCICYPGEEFNIDEVIINGTS